MQHLPFQFTFFFLFTIHFFNLPFPLNNMVTTLLGLITFYLANVWFLRKHTRRNLAELQIGGDVSFIIFDHFANFKMA